MATFSKKNAITYAHSLRKYVGKQLALFGGGGFGGELVRLNGVKAEPASLTWPDPEAHKDEWIVEVSLSGVGRTEELSSLFTETKYYGKDGHTPLKHPIVKKKTFEPHLGSWRLGVITGGL